MKLLNEWISDDLLTALGWTLVHSLWQLIVVGGLLWVGLKLVKKSSSALKYGLAVGALVFSFLLTLGTFSYEWSKTASNSGLTQTEIEFFLNQPDLLIQGSTWESRVDQATSWIENNLPVLVNFWFFGALLFLFRLLNSLSELRGLRKNAQVLVDAEIQRTVYQLGEKLGISREVELRISELAQSPLTFGTVKPVILLPAALIFHLSPAQLEAIIAHELAHVKRNDYLSNLLLSGLEILFFFHPCYWWMSQTVKELRENAADDLALHTGIEPKVLAISLAEVLNFSKQNPPELALAAGKKRNPTLLRIKRMLGYQTENYPQTPIISIPMLLTLVLSFGLMASAQQDAANSELRKPEKSAALQQAFLPALDTIPSLKLKPSNTDLPSFTITTDDGKTYHLYGDKLISGKDTLVLNSKVKSALDKLMQLDGENMPELIIPDAPEYPEELEIVPPSDFEFSNALNPMPEMPEFPMPIAPFDHTMFMDLNMPIPPISFHDTLKMSPQEKEKLATKMEKQALEWEAKFEKEFAPKMKEFEEKMKAWNEANEPKLKEFEHKLKAWQEANEPKMKEFEAKMKAWQEAQEPKMKEFELKMKEWEAAQKPKMEEFQRKMEVWQKQHREKLEEFQKLLKEELQKERD